MTVSEEVERVGLALQRAVKRAGYKQCDVEELLGWGQGYLSQLIHDNVELKVRQILEVLALVGVSSQDFFAELAGIEVERRSAPKVPATSDLDDLWPSLEEMVRAEVRAELDRRLSNRKHRRRSQRRTTLPMAAVARKSD